MASRRPPSQRDPGYAVHRTAGTIAQILPGARVKNASLVKSRTTSAQTVRSTNKEKVNVVVASGAAVTLPDPDAASISRVTLTAANCAFTFPALGAGVSFTLILVQDATGSRAATWPASVSWPGGTAPTLTATAGKADVFSFLSDDATVWRGFVAGQNYT